MFSLHEITRTRLCRAAFLALCIAPTCAVLAWSTIVHLDWYRHAHQRAIAARLGWQVRLAEASTPRPGILLYRWLELADPENGQLLAQLPYVEIETGDVLEIRLPYPAVVNGTRLDAFWKLMRDQARAHPGSSIVRFEAQNLTLHLADGDQTITGVVGELNRDDVHAQAKLQFCRAMSGLQSAEPCSISFTRLPSAENPEHVVDLTTGSTPLPSALVAAIWPGVEQLGKSCHFAGRLSAVEREGTWTAEVDGQLSEVDLDLLVSRQFPHKLSGLASVRVKRATLADGRVERAAGSVTAGPGVISRSLVQAAETHLQIQAAAAAISGPGNLLAYDKLCVGFEVGPEGMTLRGEVPRTRGGMLVDTRRVLAGEPPVTAQPVVALVRALVPQSEVHVPATRETVVLTGRLPVPSIVPAPGHEEPLPHARPVRVRPAPPSSTLRR